MIYGDLKNKLLKLVQAYETEKKWNTEFEMVLRRAHNTLHENKKISHWLKELEGEHASNSHKLLTMQTDLKKSDVFKDTIKK